MSGGSPGSAAAQPHATHPDATQPDATQPDATQPDATQPTDLRLHVRADTDDPSDVTDITDITDADLAALDEMPIAEHAAAYAGLHDRLQEALASLDDL